METFRRTLQGEAVKILDCERTAGAEPANWLAPAALIVISTLAVLYTLHVARVVLIPVAVALMLHLLFAPLVGRLSRKGVPAAISSAVILTTLLLGLILAGNALVDPARDWLKDAPTSMGQIAREFEKVKAPLQDVKELGEKVGEMAKIDSDKAPAPAVEIRDLNGLEKLVQNIPAFLTSVVITFLISFFLMSTGDRLAYRIVSFGTSWRAKSQIIRVCRGMQQDVSRHLRTITLINLALGLATGLALYFMDVPNPELWGAMVALFNFAPYAGAIVSTLVLAVVGVSTSTTMTEALMVPAVFVALTSLEGAVITPLVLGRRLNLSPLVVFLSVVFWGWLWGIPGALMAVPIVAITKIVLGSSPRTRPVARLMES